jgi:long-chain fatty acid transport protein
MRVRPDVFVRAIAAAAAIAFVFVATPAHAGGLALFEQGARGMGFAGAFTAQADDPSAIFHNAAGIAFLKGRQLQAGGALNRPRTTFTGADPFPGPLGAERTEGLPLLPPAVYYTHQFSERLVLGAGLTRPFAVRTRWENPEAFSGRFLSQRAEIDTLSLNPTAAYRAADRLAVGVGLDIRLSSIALRRRFPGLHPDSGELVDAASVRIDSRRDTAVGFNVGVLARPIENLSLGAQYRHGVAHGYQGEAEFSLLPTGSPALDAAVAAVIPAGTLPVRTALRFPAAITTGAAYEWGDWTFAGDVGFELWSKLRQIAIDFEGREDLREVVVQDYADSLQVRVGAERRLGRAWAVRGGYFFSDSPAPAASLSPLLFDADRHGITLGGSWRQGPWRVDAAGGIVRSQPRATGGTSRDGYDGTYETRAVTAGLSVGYVF